MKPEQIALTLYTLRDYCKTSPDLAQTLKKVKEIGYRAVQLSGVGPIPTKDLAEILRGEGLTCCGTHEPGDMILDRPESVAERLSMLGCPHTSYPYPGGISLASLSDVKGFATRLNASGKVLYDAGVVLTYHNHSIEFRRFEGRLMLEILYEETDPRYLQGEIDTYWVQHGGGDPVDWCRRLAGRLPLLHLKDFGIDSENRQSFMEVGSGNLNWKSIIPTAESSGCLWFIVEQDTCPGDPFLSARLSYDYIKRNLCGL